MECSKCHKSFLGDLRCTFCGSNEVFEEGSENEFLEELERSSEEDEVPYFDLDTCDEREFNDWMDSLQDGKGKHQSTIWFNYIWHYKKETHQKCKFL